MNTQKMGRRDFMQGVAWGAAALSALGLGPLRAIAQTVGAVGAASTAPTGKRLLILNLAGGFDPLFVLQPEVGALADLRRPLFQDSSTLLPFTDQLGLTPSFPLLGELFARREALVVHRVSVINSTREHLASERINALGASDRRMPPQRGGWVQRVADANPQSFQRITDVVDLSGGNLTVSGGRQPAAIVSASLQTYAAASLPDVRVLDQAGVYAADAVSVQTPLALAGAQGMRAANELSRSLAVAMQDEARTREMLGSALVAYPDSGLGRSMQAAETVFTQLKTQVAYVRTGGFDTHTQQRDRIAELFGNVNASLTALRSNLIAKGMWDDTIILTTTDFGRELRMNSSAGTDHGVGADTFLIGPSVAGGRIIGEDYGPADFAAEKRFLDRGINSQNVLREVVEALGYAPESSFAPFDGAQKLGLFTA
jgi:uncharacterized protein (DUF1501 family)